MHVTSFLYRLAMKPPRLLLAGAVVLACVSPAVAQTPRVEGPFSGLFGGQSGNRKVTQSLDFRGSVFGLYQDVLRPTAQEAVDLQLDPRYQESGSFGGVSGSMDYAYQRGAKQSGFYINGHAAAADYSVQPEDIAAVYSASTGLNAQLTRKITFNASGYTGYAPFYNFGAAIVPGASPIPGAPPVGNGLDQTLPGSNFGFGAILEPNVTLGATSGVTATLSKRSNVNISGDYRLVRLFGPQEANTGYRSWNAGGTFRHTLTKQLTLRLGYHREVSQFTNSQPQYSRNGYEFGLDYGDTFNLPLGRRTTLSVVLKFGDFGAGRVRLAFATSEAALDGAARPQSSGESGLNRNWRMSRHEGGQTKTNVRGRK